MNHEEVRGVLYVFYEAFYSTKALVEWAALVETGSYSTHMGCGWRPFYFALQPSDADCTLMAGARGAPRLADHTRARSSNRF